MIPGPNEFKQALAAGTPQVGLWLTVGSPTVTEIAAGAGYDWLLIDMEHSPNDLVDVLHHLRAAVGGTAEPAVRVPWNEPVQVKRLLDMGARTLMFPYVESAEEARRAVAATRYPPHGMRGFAGTSRATDYGRIANYAAHAAEDICVLVQIETPAALAAIPDIAAVEGVDGIFIGPNDLAANMGHLADAGAPAVRSAIADAVARIKAAGKAPGILDFNEERAKQLFAAGCVFIAVNGDAGILAREMGRIARTFRRN